MRGRVVGGGGGIGSRAGGRARPRERGREAGRWLTVTVTQPTPWLDGGVASQAVNRHMNAPVGRARTTKCLCQAPVGTFSSWFSFFNYYSFVSLSLCGCTMLFRRLWEIFRWGIFHTLCRTSVLSRHCLFIDTANTSAPRWWKLFFYFCESLEAGRCTSGCDLFQKRELGSGVIAACCLCFSRCLLSAKWRLIVRLSI